MRVIINCPGESPEDLSDYVGEVSSMLGDGFIEGHTDSETHWKIESNPL